MYSSKNAKFYFQKMKNAQNSSFESKKDGKIIDTYGSQHRQISHKTSSCNLP